MSIYCGNDTNCSQLSYRTYYLQLKKSTQEEVTECPDFARTFSVSKPTATVVLFLVTLFDATHVKITAANKEAEAGSGNVGRAQLHWKW